jgi:alpha-beta hydrolase superfamily lysophospholipase
VTRAAGELDPRSVRIGGVDVHYGDSPQGSGTVLLLCGIGLTYRAYPKLISRFRQAGFRVVSPHIPDLAKVVDKAELEVTLKTIGVTSARFTDAVDIEEPLFAVGHSMGGGIAAETVAIYPERFYGMILINSIGPSDDRERARTTLDWALSFPSDLMMTRDILGTVSSVTGDVFRALGSDSQHLMSLANAAQRADITSALKSVRDAKIPAYVIHSDNDRVIRFRSYKKTVEILGCDSEVVQGAHGWMLTDARSIESSIMPKLLEMREVAYSHQGSFGSLLKEEVI